MNILEHLRSDVDDAGREAEHVGENATTACLAILEEFIAGHEVVAVQRHIDDSGLLCEVAAVERYGLSYEYSPRFSIIVPRDPEPRITDHTLTERMAVLEDEVKHRCGCLGRRVFALEDKRDRPLLAAAEVALVLMREMQAGRRRGNWAAFDTALDALAAAIKKERER